MGKSASERCKNIQFNLLVIIVIGQITLILDANPFDRSGNLSAPCGEKLRQSAFGQAAQCMDYCDFGRARADVLLLVAWRKTGKQLTL